MQNFMFWVSPGEGKPGGNVRGEMSGLMSDGKGPVTVYTILM